MAEAIDELLVRLKLDSDAKSFKEANNQFTNLRTTALVTGGAIAGAFAGAVKMSADVARSADELAKWSRTAGVTAQYASKLGYAMRQVGGSDADALGLIELTNSLRDSAQWGELADRAFTAAGFNPQRIEQERMSPEQVIEFLSQGLSSMQLDQRRQIADSLGIGDKAFRLLSDRQGMQRNFQRADELGGIPTDELLANAEAYTSATTEFSEAVNGFKQSVANEMLPGMTRFVEGITGWSIENRDEIESAIREGVPYLKTIATATGLLVGAQLGMKGVAFLAANAPLAAAVGLATFYMDKDNRDDAGTSWTSASNYWKRRLFGVGDDPRFTPAGQPGEGLINDDVPDYDDVFPAASRSGLSADELGYEPSSSELIPHGNQSELIEGNRRLLPNYVPAMSRPTASNATTMNINVDARGSTDPLMTSERVRGVIRDEVGRMVDVSRDGIPTNVA